MLAISTFYHKQARTDGIGFADGQTNQTRREFDSIRSAESICPPNRLFPALITSGWPGIPCLRHMGMILVPKLRLQTKFQICTFYSFWTIVQKKSVSPN